MRRMKALLGLLCSFLVLGHGTALAQSQLSGCQGSAPARWDNCVGSWTNRASNEKYQGEWQGGKPNGQGTHTFANGERYIGGWREGRYHGPGVMYAANGSVISQGTWADNQLVKSSSGTGSQLSDAQRLEVDRRAAQLEDDRQRLAQDRARLDADKAQREQAKQAARIVIQASASQPDANGDYTIRIQTNADTSSFKIDGQEIGGRADGNYTINRVARLGQETRLTLAARDVYGNTDIKTLLVARPVATAVESIAPLNVANLRTQPAKDAVAIIIGIQDYKRLPRAEFANEDARAFNEYARRGLGIRPDNIKVLLDAEADVVDILKAFTNWLPAKVNKDKTEVYVFFSGHGLPSDDGKLYLLPHGVDKDLLEKTSVGQKELVAALQAAKPKSVTMFIDSCYSGQARGGETLAVFARPVSLKVEETAYPANFTVISASANSQISSASPELKHGIFSYYLMKGMEGDADDNKDGKITIGEMQGYLADKVPRHAMKMNRKQEPQLVGDANRVFVTR